MENISKMPIQKVYELINLELSEVEIKIDKSDNVMNFYAKLLHFTITRFDTYYSIVGYLPFPIANILGCSQLVYHIHGWSYGVTESEYIFLRQQYGYPGICVSTQEGLNYVCRVIRDNESYMKMLIV